MTEFDSETSTLVPTRPDPGWPKAIGVISIILGLLSIVLGSLGMVFSWFVLPGLVESQLNGAPLPPNMQMSPAMLAYATASALVNLLLVTAGVQTFCRRGVGRTMHLAYAVLLSITTIGGTYFQYQLARETLAWAQDYPDNPIAQQASAGGEVGQLIGLLAGSALSLAWPVFCIIWFGMVKRDADAMRGGAADD
ncbi:MAG: hypothetical protein AAGI17_04915 [Planctomycetota bacterium]